MDGALGIAENILYTGATVLVTIFLGFVVAKLLGRLVNRILSEAEINRLLKQSGIKAIDQRIARIVEIAVYVITVLVVLQQLGLTQIVIAIIVIATALALGLFLFLALKSNVPNFLKGFAVRKELKKHVGDIIEIGGVKGKLTKVGLIQSLIHEKEKIYIPHSYSAKYIKQLQAD